MIAADSSSLVAFLRDEIGADVDLIATAMTSGQLVLPPAVVAEVLSGSTTLQETLMKIAKLELTDGYWERVGAIRRKLQEAGLKARLGDALIAQSCIDHDVRLITRDNDFRHFEKYCGLKLA